MASLNKVSLIGHVGHDPQVYATKDGKDIVSFSLATTETWKDKAGVRQDHTEWHRIAIFHERLTTIAKSYIKKGSQIYIEGQLKTRKWLDKTGQEKYTTEITLQGLSSVLVLLDSKRQAEGMSDPNQSMPRYSANTTQ
jgi:single-strand DNA-binding protein